ncbi:Peptide chain release factor 1-like, mitochondrial, partial [Ophiophagus hannah]
MWWCFGRSRPAWRKFAVSFPSASAGRSRCSGQTLPRRWLSSQPDLRELFARPALRRFLDQHCQPEEQPGGFRSALAARIRLLGDKEEELRETEQLVREDENEDLRKLAEKEIISCEEEIEELRHQIVSLLIPSAETDKNDLVIEVTAGVGGLEAMLFTAEMFDMYQQYAAYKNWTFDTLTYTSRGLRHASASIKGLEAYGQLKFEGGVHRVQRVPKTEKQGRIHTSTMTVAVLPQPSEITLTINPKDLYIETKRASGAGGQHVNTTDSAVRIVHIPSGIVSECQQERSQIRNKEKAMELLHAKLYSIKLEEQTAKIHTARKIQDRVTDHRIGKSVHHIERFMLGEELLDEMIESLRRYSEYEMLME